MQNSAEISCIMNDSTQYIMIPSLKFSLEMGTYASYDIAAYDCFDRDIVAIVPDVTADRNLALYICDQFNRYQLSPIHLDDAVCDMVKQSL